MFSLKVLLELFVISLYNLILFLIICLTTSTFFYLWLINCNINKVNKHYNEKITDNIFKFN